MERDGCKAKQCAACGRALILRRTAAVASYLGLQNMYSQGRGQATEVGDSVTVPHDQGKPHEDRAAEGVSHIQAVSPCLPRLIPSCSYRGLPFKVR